MSLVVTGVKILTFAIWIGGIAQCTYGAELSAHDLVADSIFNYDKDWQAALAYSYTVRDVNGATEGQAKTIDVSRVSVLNGTPYSRLIGKNGHPLSEEEARKEDEKYQKVADARARETPDQRARRIRKYQEDRRFLHEIPDAFEMKMIGHETIAGRPNYVIELTPKPGYVPKSRAARMFSEIEGKLWIDEWDQRWTQAKAEVIDTISIGWVLARIGPGTHIALKQMKVDGEHWLPAEIDINGTARIMLLKTRELNETVSYSDYHRIDSPPGNASAKNR